MGALVYSACSYKCGKSSYDSAIGNRPLVLECAPYVEKNRVLIPGPVKRRRERPASPGVVLA